MGIALLNYGKITLICFQPIESYGKHIMSYLLRSDDYSYEFKNRNIK